MGKYGVQWVGKKSEGVWCVWDKGASSQGCFNKSGLLQNRKVSGNKDGDLKSGEGQR